jgi:hypothetical protein
MQHEAVRTLCQHCRTGVEGIAYSRMAKGVSVGDNHLRRSSKQRWRDDEDAPRMSGLRVRGGVREEMCRTHLGWRGQCVPYGRAVGGCAL